MDKHDKIYIAGHRGLVGSALVRKLLADGYTNLVTCSHGELDLTAQEEVNDFFLREKPSYVFLAAAKGGRTYANNTYPADFIADNLAIQTNVIHEAYRSGVKRLMFLGSSCIYPKLAPQPMKNNISYRSTRTDQSPLCNSKDRWYRNVLELQPSIRHEVSRSHAD